MEAGRAPNQLDFGDIAPGRKGEILAAALSVFGERGYDGGSMREIASRVGVSEAALYRHFSGKEAIFLGLIDAVGVAVRQEGVPKLLAIRAESLEADLGELLRDRRKTVRLMEPALRVILPEVMRNKEWMAQMQRLVALPALSALLEKVEALDTQLGVTDAEQTRPARVRMLLSLFFGYLASSFVLGDEQDEAMVMTLLHIMRWDEQR
jgi:AcrR family transcriptional regulator